MHLLKIFKQKKYLEVFAVKKINSIFAAVIAEVAQLVERDLAKVEVAGPSPVCRSSF